MAKYYDGYMGAFSGKLGTAIGYMWKGRPCLRSRQANPKNRRTKAQQQGRRIFGATSTLAANMIDATQIGLRGPAAIACVSESNIFVRLNRQAVSVDDDIVNIDYTLLKVSAGELPGVAFGGAHVDDSGEISVEYSMIEGHSGSYNDYVYLYAYMPEMGYGQLSMPSARSEHRVCLTLPPRCTGRTVHLYGFVWDHDREASPSTYIGGIILW